MKIAVFPGSFDPITTGHVDVVSKAIPLFDKIVIGIGSNSSKKYMFSLKQREKWLRQVFRKHKTVEIKTYNSLTVDFCKEVKAGFILRGLRSTIDFEYEKPIAHLNQALNPKIETVFLLASENLSSVSSTIIREIIRHGGDVSAFIPEGIRLK